MFRSLRSLFGKADAKEESALAKLHEDARKELEEKVRKEVEEKVRKEIEADFQQKVVAVLRAEQKGKKDESDEDEDDDDDEVESELEEGDDDTETPRSTTSTTTTPLSSATLKRKRDSRKSGDGEESEEEPARKQNSKKQERKRAKQMEQDYERLKAEMEQLKSMHERMLDAKTKKSGKKLRRAKKASEAPSPGFNFGDSNSTIAAGTKESLNTNSDSLNTSDSPNKNNDSLNTKTTSDNTKTQTSSKNVTLNVAPAQTTSATTTTTAVTEAPQKKKVMISFHVGSMGSKIPTLVEALEAKGFDVFDCVTKITSGSMYRPAIVEATVVCDVFITLMNKEWIMSGECLAETLIAVDRFTHRQNIAFVPIALDGALDAQKDLLQKLKCDTLDAQEHETVAQQSALMAWMMPNLQVQFIKNLNMWPLRVLQIAEIAEKKSRK